MTTLSDRNIYSLTLDDDLGRDDLRLLYAPVAGNMMVVSTQEAEAIEHAIGEGNPADEEMAKVVHELTVGTPASERDSKVKNVDEFLLMYVLPNYTCNFACSYCFSAKGRSKQVLKREQLQAALDYFVDRKRIDTDRLAISYLGGGEPTLSWDLLRFGLEYAEERATKQGIRMMTTVVTNASRINEEMVQVFSKHRVQVRVSFEILEEIQNKQRGQYAAVCRGLDLLAACSVPPMVRAMITPDNVDLLSSMIERLHERFPYVKQALFDPITSSQIFADVDFTRDFYDRYYHSFLKARALAATLGIDLGCTPLRNLNMVVERFCTGEFCLTPEGTITLCHQISSPKEANYSNYIYARVNEENRLEIDNDKFKTLTARNTIYTNPKCKDCFVKWNCGGGCMMQNSQYSQEILDVICDFTRRFSKTLLVERLRTQFEDEGEDFDKHIKSYGE